jgi:hypothetical protein
LNKNNKYVLEFEYELIFLAKGAYN